MNSHSRPGRTTRRAPLCRQAHTLFALATFALVSGCDLGTGAGDFSAEDFFGEWHLSVAATPCFPAMEIDFVINDQAIDFSSDASFSIEGAWGLASDPSLNRRLTGFLTWSSLKTFSFAFYDSGAVMGMLTGGEEGFSSDRLEGSFFDPIEQTCNTPATAIKS